MRKRIFVVLSLLTLIFSSCSFKNGQIGNNSISTNYDDAIYHTVTFDSNGGTPIESQTVKHGEKIIKPVDPVREGSTFLGWYYNDELWSFVDYSCTADMTLTAKYQYETLSITLKYCDEITDDKVIYLKIGDAYDFGTPSRYGYDFVTWTNNIDDFASSGIWEIGHNEIIYAKWKAKEYKVIFDLDGGYFDPNDLANISDDNSCLVTYGLEYSLPTPKKDNFSFDGWYRDNYLFESSGIWKIVGDINVKARWSTMVTSKYLPNKSYKKVYRSAIYFAAANPNLNYMETSDSSDAQHYANFVDGLLTYNEFGVLEKNLASDVKINENYTKFIFTIRKNVPWMRYDGTQYEAFVNGNNEPQFVKPSDWLASAKAILTAQNASSLEYLISDFVRGAAEYYYYTDLMYKIATNSSFRNQYNTNDKKASYINSQIKTNKENLYNIFYKDNPVTADDLTAIDNLSRLGIKVDDEAMTLEYELIQGTYYFPTLLTNSCYLPVNQYFLADKRFSSFGVGYDDILYNGPFIFSEAEDDNLIYQKNESYWNKDTVYVDKVIYTVYDNLSSSDYLRNLYFNGHIDEFYLNPRDTNGWQQFVTGGDNSGSVFNPASNDVNVSLSDPTSSIYGSNITLGRTKDAGSKVSYSTKGNSTTVANTEKALAIEPVRKAILDALDYDTYYCLYGDYEPYKSQCKVNTYVPKNFVQSLAGDYVTTHYYQEYAKQKGIPSGTNVNDGATLAKDGTLIPDDGSAAWILENGRLDRCNKTDAEVYALAQNAKAAMDKWNEDNPTDKITFPVQVEYFTAWDADDTGDSKMIDSESILRMNQRLNGTTSESASDFTMFYVVPTDAVTYSTLDTLSHTAAFDYAPVLWYWDADYADPSTFLNTYTKNGEWKAVFPYVGFETCDNYFYDEETNTLEKTDLLAEYTSLIKEANAITSDINSRFDKFAEAEYMLLEELSIYRPQVNFNQGWSLSITNANRFECPKSNYGLSQYRFIGLKVATSTITNLEMNQANIMYIEDKNNYISSNGVFNF